MDILLHNVGVPLWAVCLAGLILAVLAVLRYAVNLCEQTRVHPLVEMGVSPRGIAALASMAQANKEDKPIVRIPGSPGFFDMVVLADFGKAQQGQPIAPEKRNAAYAYGSAALQQMVRKGVRCCLALPEGDSITLLPMENRQDYRQAMARWMATPLPANTGDAMCLLRLEHLENRFARLLLLSVDGLTDEQELHGCSMAITVLSAVESGSEQTREVDSIRVTELPAKPDRERVYRLYC